MRMMDKPSDAQYDQVPTKEHLEDKDQVIPTKYGYGVRHFQLAILFVSVAVTFLARGHMGVTIVAITNVNKMDVNETIINDTISKVHIGTADASVGNGNVTNNATEQKGIYKTYDWSKPIQETIQGAFFVGYSIMMFPSGLVCQRWGGKLSLQICLLINGVTSFLTPWLILWGDWKAMCVCRGLQGLSQAGAIPGSQSLLAKWVPESERSRLLSYVYTGSTLGTVIAYQLSGILAESSWGWPAIFWMVGVLCLLAFSLLTMFGANSPADHKCISVEEKNFIVGSINSNVQKRKTPWKAIITSKPLWAAIVTQIGTGIGIVFCLTEVPSFIHYILEINVRNSGILSSLPYVASIFTGIGFGVLSDYLINRKLISIQNARRISNSISQVGMAVCLICASFSSNPTVAVICFIVAQACQTAFHTGWLVNHIDLAPNYSPTLMAIGNSLTYVFVVNLPVCVSNIVTDMIRYQKISS